MVALFRDITSRKDNELAMAEARRAAEEASETKSRFLATIGHELRTPLNAVVGFSEMMTSGIGGELSPTHREYAGLIHQSGKHLLEVVRMLLDMSKIEAGKFELQTEAFMIEDLIEPCFSMVEAMAAKQQVTLAVDIVDRCVQAEIVGFLRHPRRVLVDVGEGCDEGVAAQRGRPQGLETAHGQFSHSVGRNGWVACQCLAMSMRRAHQTLSWLFTYSMKRASEAKRAGRPSRRQCMPIDSIFGAPAWPSA